MNAIVEVRYGCMMLHGTWFCLPLSTACSSLHASLRYVACSLMCSGALFTFGHLGAISPQRGRLHAFPCRDGLDRDRRTVWTHKMTRFQKFVLSCVWCFSWLIHCELAHPFLNWLKHLSFRNTLLVSLFLRKVPGEKKFLGRKGS